MSAVRGIRHLRCAGLRGNLLNSDTLTNTFDAANHLIETERAGSTLEPIYNGIGDRVGQTTSVTTTYFALDVMGLPEVIYTTEGNLYLHLPGVMMAESGTGEIRYLLSDGLGSVRQATDESGEVVAYNEFDPYGNPVQDDSSPYGFTGEWWESDIGLLHLRARWYAPETGTFLSVDPVESEPPYQYVRGNPINFTDPSGYCRPAPGETSCQETIQTEGGTIRGTTQVLGETTSEVVEGNGPSLRVTTITVYTCGNENKTCQMPPPTSRPTLQPWIDGLNNAGYYIAWPFAVAGETRTLVQGGLAYEIVTQPRSNVPMIRLMPNRALQEVPTGVARLSTYSAYGLPVAVGILNDYEIRYRQTSGEINQTQASGQRMSNVGYTIAGSVGGGYVVPQAAALTSNPIGWATGGTLCLAYDISIIQGTTNNMIEGQPLWPAYIDARADVHNTLTYGHSDNVDQFLEQSIISAVKPVVVYINSDD